MHLVSRQHRIRSVRAAEARGRARGTGRAGWVCVHLGIDIAGGSIRLLTCRYPVASAHSVRSGEEARGSSIVQLIRLQLARLKTHIQGESCV
jgi:hypothetical protein